MGRKTKSKQRLDKYYNLAKQQGYRSRAAFKLIQLNRKYNFLSSCNVLVDLCAAPGGWLQVASNVMPMGATILGLDIVTIKPIPHCKVFQQDISTPGALQLLRKNLRDQKADVFLHDGAPNVGASWVKDAFNQNELVLVSLKLAANFLKKGGIFITKVFRSADYNSLMWVFNKFFDKVEATKPVASRFVSAEIFVVCLGFTAPTYIDEKLFDAKHVFKDSEVDQSQIQMHKEIVSVAKLLEKRRRRSGYADDAPLTVYKTLQFADFLSAENPFPLFLENNKMHLSVEDFKMYTTMVKPPPDLEILLADIQVLGKREILQLLKWKSKIKHAIWKQKKADGVTEEEPKEFDGEEQDEDMEEEELEFENDEQDNEQVEEEVQDGDQDSEVYDDLVEMQKELLNKQSESHQRLELKELRKQRDKKFKSMKKLQGAGGTGIESDEELFNLKKHSQGMKKVTFIDVGEEGLEKPVINQLSYVDHKDLDKNLELIYEQKQARKQNRQNIDQQKRQDKEREKKEKNRDYAEEEPYDEDQLACERIEAKRPPSRLQKQELQQTLDHKFFDRDTFSALKDQLNSNQALDFENPLKIIKQQKKDSEKLLSKRKTSNQDSDESGEAKQPQKVGRLQRQVQDDLYDLDLYIDEQEVKQKKTKGYSVDERISQEPFPDEERKIKEYELTVPLSEMKKRRQRLAKARERLEKQKKKDKLDDNPNKGEFEIVRDEPVQVMTFDDYDIDELAFDRALGKKMLRKKTRESIIDASFSRHAVEDEDLPLWFQDDEKKHCYKMEPITKEEFLQEKEKLLAINSKVPKKIMEYKIRKWKKTQKKMRKAAQKAQVVFDQEGVDDGIKLRQVQKIYKKEKMQLNKEKDKKYIVSRKGQTGQGANKKSRHVRMVDGRLKKDKRADKAQCIRSKTKNIKKTRQVKRHIRKTRN